MSRRFILVASSSFVFVVSACSGRQGEPIAVDTEAETWDASRYCRTTTCAPPTTYPKDSSCEPPGWADECARNDKWNVALWWRTACVGYGVQKDASHNVAFADAQAAADAAFQAWPSAVCDPDATRSPAHPGVDAHDLGPVECAKATWNPSGPNQNVVLFHDATWPYDPRTLAQTWVTFDPRTGEIFDADIEVNEVDYKIAAITAPAPHVYDLQVVLTHEAGHFYGLAHSTNTAAVMYASDEGTSLAKRALNAADAEGICAIYPPGSGRSVSLLVDPSGSIAAGACDPTPHGGFTSSCQ